MTRAELCNRSCAGETRCGDGESDSRRTALVRVVPLCLRECFTGDEDSVLNFKLQHKHDKITQSLSKNELIKPANLLWDVDMVSFLLAVLHMEICED